MVEGSDWISERNGKQGLDEKGAREKGLGRNCSVDFDYPSTAMTEREKKRERGQRSNYVLKSTLWNKRFLRTHFARRVCFELEIKMSFIIRLHCRPIQ